ncbi:MAG: DsrE family protein [Phycisphaerales bacterium]|nr:DsrE family protein [Phycisphaerales bacterium]
MRTVLVLNHDQMGQGDPALGRKILGTFLRKAPALQELHAIVLFNSGARLVAADSPVLIELTQLHDNGVDLRPCGTCLDFYGVIPAIGQVSNMDEIVHELATAEKVITL